MAKKISVEAARALQNGYKFSKSNTSVRQDNSGHWTMELHGNVIAKYHSKWGLCISDGGWGALSVTTKDRLNALSGVSVWTHKFTPYIFIGSTVALFDGQAWDLGWYSVRDNLPVSELERREKEEQEKLEKEKRERLGRYAATLEERLFDEA